MHYASTGWPMFCQQGWPTVGQWLTNGWPMVGQWSSNGWPMVGQWLSNGWPMVGEWRKIINKKLSAKAFSKSAIKNCFSKIVIKDFVIMFFVFVLFSR